MSKRTTSAARWAALLTAWMILPSTAQEEATTTTVRVLTLGNRAPFLQEVRDGIRHEIDPPEGSLPPREVEAVNAIAGKETPAATVRLGEISAAMVVPVGDDRKVALKDRASGKPWLSTVLPQIRPSLLVVWRTGKNWDETRTLVLDDSPGAVPAGSARVVNVSPVEMKMLWGKERYLLPPGRGAVLRFPAGAKQVPLQIFHTDAKGKAQPCLNTTAEADSSTRRQWFVFRADRPDARTPLQVQSLAEPRR